MGYSPYTLGAVAYPQHIFSCKCKSVLRQYPPDRHATYELCKVTAAGMFGRKYGKKRMLAFNFRRASFEEQAARTFLIRY
ncbi:hypothetical protein BaRGS_00023113 [Batillaria attramentaria]|uniref:Uncharacterized protein n=1 Tax=Batillaria attramentaria TaxID=370345 RepID=A0ABD0KEU6_9CAEN